ncbi:MAG: MATE family efflux transporter [Clostridia bacterium]|nr:MATE family efflux transporter [Clostridia bacterium]
MITGKKKLFKDVNMLDGPILSRMIIYTVPLMISGLLQILYNAADVAIVGQFGADKKLSLAAVGSTGALTNLIVGLFMGLGTGATVVVSKYIGAGEKKNASETVHTSVVTALFFGVMLSFVGVGLAKPLLALMKSPDTVINLAALYIRIYFIGLPMIMLYNFGSAILRAKGDTMFPLVVLIASGIINILLNLLLVIVFKLDVAGVAWATVASQTVSAILVMIHLSGLPEDDCCKFYIKKLRVHWDKLGRIAAIGLPSGLQGVVFSLSNVLLQTAVNTLGDTAIAGNTAAANIDGFIYTACNSVYHASVAFTGQNYGAHNVKRIKKVAQSSYLIVFVIGFVLGSIALIFADPLLRIYAPGEENIEVRANGLLRLQITAMLYFLCGMMEVSTGLLRGMNRSVIPMIISIFGSCVFRICWFYFVFYPFDYFRNLFWLFVSYPISWILTMSVEFLMFVLVFRKLSRQEDRSLADAAAV